VIFYCNLATFCKAYVGSSDVLLLTFQPVFLKKQLITWFVVWRFSPTEKNKFSNLSFLLVSLLCC